MGQLVLLELGGIAIKKINRINNFRYTRLYLP